MMTFLLLFSHRHHLFSQGSVVGGGGYCAIDISVLRVDGDRAYFFALWRCIPMGVGEREKESQREREKESQREREKEKVRLPHNWFKV